MSPKPNTMEEAERTELSEPYLQRARDLMQSATRIERYILQRLDSWYYFRECSLMGNEMRVLNMHEDLDGTPTDWRKILLVFNEPQIGNYPILTIYPPKDGSNMKHLLTIELMDKDKPLEPEGLFWLGMFRSKIEECGIKLLCKEKLTYDDQNLYKVHIALHCRLKLSFSKTVELLEMINGEGKVIS